MEEEEALGYTASHIDWEVVAVAEDMAPARRDKVRLDQLGPDGRICSLNTMKCTMDGRQQSDCWGSEDVDVANKNPRDSS